MVKIKNLLDMVNEESKERKKKAKKEKALAVGVALVGVFGALTCIMMKKGMLIEMRKNFKSKVLDCVDKTKNHVQSTSKYVNAAAGKAATAASSVINDIDEKTNDFNGDVKSGYQNIKNDINKTTEDISTDLKKAEK